MRISTIDTWIKETEGICDLSPKQMEALQLKKLNSILTKEKARNGFYKHLPQQLEHLEDLVTLPFTDSRDLVKYGPQMVLVSQSAISKVSTEMTSGTTGSPKRLFYTQYDRERTGSFFTAGLSELISRGDTVLVCMPSDGAGGLLVLICDAIKRLGAIPIAFGVGKSYEEFFKINACEAPNCFIGMPVPLLSALRYAAFLRINLPLKKALLSADACAPSVFSAIEAYLSRKPYIHYGSRESGLGGAVNCDCFDGMHVRENDILVEIIDQNGNRVKDGEFGELVITTIGMDAMPLIRYKTGDRTRVLPGTCRCKSRLKRLDHVFRIGTEHAIVTLDEILFSFPEVIDYKAAATNESLDVEIAAGNEIDSGGIIETLIANGFTQKIKVEIHEIHVEDAAYYLGKRKLKANYAMQH